MSDTRKYYERVKKEYVQHKEKTDRLHKFVMKSAEFKKLSPAHQILLKKQCVLMIELLKTLQARIKEFERELMTEAAENRDIPEPEFQGLGYAPGFPIIDELEDAPGNGGLTAADKEKYSKLKQQELPFEQER